MRKKWYYLFLSIAGSLLFLIAIMMNEYVSLLSYVGGALMGFVFAQLIRQTNSK